VAEGIVDELEAIEIQEHDGELAPTPLGMSDGLAQAILHQGPVGELGKEIVISLKVHDLLGALSLRHVTCRPERAEKTVAGTLPHVGIDTGGRELHEDGGRIEVASSPSKPFQTELDVTRRTLSRAAFVEREARNLTIVIVNELAVVSADQLLPRKAEERHDSFVEKAESPIGIEHVHELGAGIHQKAMELLRITNRELQALALPVALAPRQHVADRASELLAIAPPSNKVVGSRLQRAPGILEARALTHNDDVRVDGLTRDRLDHLLAAHVRERDVE
jgi:hypothetical protein